MNKGPSFTSLGWRQQFSTPSHQMLCQCQFILMIGKVFGNHTESDAQMSVLIDDGKCATGIYKCTPKTSPIEFDKYYSKTKSTKRSAEVVKSLEDPTLRYLCWWVFLPRLSRLLK